MVSRMASSSLPITRLCWARIASVSWARNADLNDKHMDLDGMYLSCKASPYHALSQCAAHLIDNGFFCNGLLLSTNCSGICSAFANNTQRDHWLVELLVQLPCSWHFSQLILEAKAGHELIFLRCLFVCLSLGAITVKCMT